MAGTLGILPWQTPFNSGATIPNAKLFVYNAGSTTKRAIYTTSALSAQHSNPLVANANGRFAAFWINQTGGDYKLVLAPANDSDPPAAAIQTEDNIPSYESQPILDIRRYGYVANDSYDNATAFNAAIDAAGTLGGACIQLPPGTARIGSSIVVDVPNVVIRGCGRSTIVKASANSFSLFQPRAASIEFRDVALYGAASATGAQWGIFTEQTYASRYLSAINVYFGGSSSSARLNSGIKFDEGWHDGRVQDCLFDEMQGEDGGGGYNVLTGAVDRLHVHHNTFLGATGSPNRGRHAVYLSTGAKYCSVTGNLSIGMNQEHLTLNSLVSHPANAFNIFSDNILVAGNPSNYTTGAMSIFGKATGNRFARNTIYQPGFMGILISARSVADDCDCLDNVIEDNLIFEAGTIGIEISGSTRTTVRGNTVRDSSQNTADASPNIRLLATATSGQGVVDCVLIGNLTTGGRSGLNFNGTTPLPTGTKLRGNAFSAGTVARIEGDPAAIYEGAKGGTATINSGSTSVVVSHLLGITPESQRISIQMLENPTNDPGNVWISNITSTQFTINCRSNPGASSLDVAWQYSPHD